MTVAELIEKLREMPQDATVVRSDTEEREAVTAVDLEDDLYYWHPGECRSYRNVPGVVVS